MPNSILLKKPVVRVDTEENADFLKYAPKVQRQKISPNLEIVSNTYLDEVRKSGKYLLPSRVDIGDILTLHPFVPNQYVLIQELENATYDSLYSCMSGIARCLGATEMQWTKIIEDEGERSFDANGNVKFVPYLEANAHVGNIENCQNKIQETKTTRFSDVIDVSIEEQIQDYNEAIERVKAFGLVTHSDISELVEGRNPNKSRKITSKEVTIHMVSNINQSFDAAFSLNCMKDIFSINATIQNILRVCRNVELRYSLSF